MHTIRLSNGHEMYTLKWLELYSYFASKIDEFGGNCSISLNPAGDFHFFTTFWW